MKKNRIRVKLTRYVLAVCALACSLLIVSPPASAFVYESDGDLSIGLDMTLGYGASVRVEDRTSYTDLGGGMYWNDEYPYASNYKGDLEYDTGLISSTFRAMAELDLAWPLFGFKSTASYSYDTEVMNRSRKVKLDPTYGTPINGWSDEAEENSGSVLELLDAYAYATLMDGRIDLRVGKQVIYWGESLFFLDGVGVQSPLNINKLVLAGAEFKEAFMGTGAVRAQIAATDSLSFDAYYQWEWQKNKWPGAGTYYGEDYLAAPGSETEMLYLIGPAVEAKDDGQWGVATKLMYGDAEIGLYYSRYHDAMPMVFMDFNMIGPWLLPLTREKFSEDQDMFGATLATSIGMWSVSFEGSFRPDRTVGTFVWGKYFGGLRGDGEYWVEADTANFAVLGVGLGGATILGIDAQVTVIQLGMDYINYDGDFDDLMPMGVRHASVTGEPDIGFGTGGYTLTPGEKGVTPTAWGIAGVYDMIWQGVTPGLDLTLDLFAQYDFSGVSHMWGNFSEGRLITGVTLIANYGYGWEGSIGYSRIDDSTSNYETQDTINIEVNYKF